MHKNLTVLLFVFALLVTSGIAATLADEVKEHHGEDHGQIIVRGEILDMACFVSHGAKGSDHAACAKRCAKGGQPMGLLADDGTIYLLYADHKDASAFEAAKEHAGAKVEIMGKQASQAGFKGIEIHRVRPL